MEVEPGVLYRRDSIGQLYMLEVTEATVANIEAHALAGDYPSRVRALKQLARFSKDIERHDWENYFGYSPVERTEQERTALKERIKGAIESIKITVEFTCPVCLEAVDMPDGLGGSCMSFLPCGHPLHMRCYATMPRQVTGWCPAHRQPMPHERSVEIRECQACRHLGPLIQHFQCPTCRCRLQKNILGWVRA